MCVRVGVVKWSCVMSLLEAGTQVCVCERERACVYVYVYVCVVARPRVKRLFDHGTKVCGRVCECACACVCVCGGAAVCEEAPRCWHTGEKERGIVCVERHCVCVRVFVCMCVVVQPFVKSRLNAGTQVIDRERERVCRASVCVYVCVWWCGRLSRVSSMLAHRYVRETERESVCVARVWCCGRSSVPRVCSMLAHK